ncbi:MAG: FHA domain-containing protein, partial [Woeseia sp.]
YHAQLAALEFLRTTHHHPQGLGVLQGPPLSGKSTIIHEFVSSLNADRSHAVVDGSKLSGQQLVAEVLNGFGFDVELGSMNEAIGMLRVYAMQQAAVNRAPLIVIENVHALQADALQVLCEIAALKVRQDSAVRLILVNDRPTRPQLQAPSLEALNSRLTGVFNLAGMDDQETEIYLYSKLAAGGCETPEAVVPESVCVELHKASGGWPGIVDRIMLFALARATSCPLSAEHIERPVVPAMTGDAGVVAKQSTVNAAAAKLFLTYQGRTVREISLDSERVMIGRSEHNEIAIASRFISRHHALFIRDNGTTLLMDLNSTNGTFVNSQRISNYIMVHDDIVTIGHHGLKFVDPAARNHQPLEGASFSDTIIMKSIDDMRRMLARETTRSLDLPENDEKRANRDD